jgi:hypothetical protein
MKKVHRTLRRGPDILLREVAEVLTAGSSYEFKALFLVVFANLRARDAANGGEEMLRLRAYEKLQNLVQQGAVVKTGKEYRAMVPALQAVLDSMTAQEAAQQIQRDARNAGSASSSSSSVAAAC